MKLIFLGTGAAEGFPALLCECRTCEKARRRGGEDLRKRTSVLVDDNILIDFGPDILTHTHLYNINLIKLDAIIITHSHADHFYIEELRIAGKPYADYNIGRQLKVYGNPTVSSIFKSKVKDNMLLQFNEIIPFKPFVTGKYTVHPLSALHGTETENSLMYAIEKDGRVFLNGNDTNYFPEETWDYIKNMKFSAVSLDTALGNGAPSSPGTPGHMNIDTVLKVKERMLEIGCADSSTEFIMTHFSHTGGLLHRELEEIGIRNNLVPAFDGMIIDV